MDTTQEHQADASQAPADATTTETPTVDAAPIPSEGAPADTTTEQQPSISFAAMDDSDISPPRIKDGTYLFVLTDFKPVLNNEEGMVDKWSCVLVAAESIPDDQGGAIETGRRVGQFSVWMSPSQFRTQESCIQTAKRWLMALNGIVIDRKKDPLDKAAKAAFRALEGDHKRPGWISHNGAAPILDTDEDLYKQWDGTILQARIRTKAGAQFSDLLDVFAKNTPRAAAKTPAKRA